MALIKRSPGLVILFSIITCGIYYIYWFVMTTNEIESSLQQKDGTVSNGGVAFLLSIVTCGIYYIYWYFKQGKRIAQLGAENNVNVSDNSTVYLILSLFGLSIVSQVLMQIDLNNIADSKLN